MDANDSLLGKITAAKATSDGNVGFLRSVVTIITTSVICLVLQVIYLAVPIACIVIGAIYLNDCPAERYIPIYLIVSGCFTIVQILTSFIQKCRSRADSGEQEGGNGASNVCDGLIGCFLFAWFICGNVWIYRTYGHFSTDDSASNYCNPILYYFSFWVLNATYILIGLAIIVCCGGCFSMCCFARNTPARYK